MSDASDDITTLLKRWRDGDSGAESSLIDRVYPALREIARQRLRPSGSLTLSATELAHEAYFRLVGQREFPFQNRSHFYAIAAHVMRRLVVDLLREREAQKRGGGVVHVTLEHVASELGSTTKSEPSVLDLDRLLSRLERIDARAARVTELRFFGGLSVEDVAETEGLSTATVKRSWSFARAWLKDQLDPAAAS
jgi:RNA polymerase sigma factor (TIGR02999 family)